MPDKIIIRAAADPGNIADRSEVVLKRADGAEVALLLVKKYIITHDADGGPPQLVLTMYTPDFLHEVEVSEITAATVLAMQSPVTFRNAAREYVLADREVALRSEYLRALPLDQWTEDVSAENARVSERLKLALEGLHAAARLEATR